VLEALRAGYPFVSARPPHLRRRGGWPTTPNASRSGRIRYYPYLEPRAGDGKGLLRALAAARRGGRHRPVSLLLSCRTWSAPRPAELPVLLEQVDSNGLLPLRADRPRCSPPRTPFAPSCRRSCRRFWTRCPPKSVAAHGRVPERGIDDRSEAHPRADGGPLDAALLASPARGPSQALPIDHGVPPSPSFRGGRPGSFEAPSPLRARSASRATSSSANETGGRRHQRPLALPALRPTSPPPDLHRDSRGAKAGRRASWRGPKGGSRQGFLADEPRGGGVPRPAHYLARELGYNMCHKAGRTTIASHRCPNGRRRPCTRTLKDPRAARLRTATRSRPGAPRTTRSGTPRETQLVREGWYHNTMRMLWGKKNPGVEPNARKTRSAR